MAGPRPPRQDRGYDQHHLDLRAHWQQLIDAGEPVHCWRCHEHGVLTRLTGRAWHLGHDDHDRSRYRGPECIPCSTATKGRQPSRARPPEPHPGRLTTA